MRSLISVCLLMLIAAPALARPVPGMNVPEPGTMSLIGLGIAGALYAAKKRRK